VNLAVFSSTVILQIGSIATEYLRHFLFLIKSIKCLGPAIEKRIFLNSHSSQDFGGEPGRKRQEIYIPMVD
jgi:hypothetical protein